MILLLSVLLILAGLTGCKTPLSKATPTPATTAVNTSEGVPKYIFLFIGDGMSAAQAQAAALYLGSGKQGFVSVDPGFMSFPVTGFAETYDTTAYCPDSSSTGTAIATGVLTASNRLGMDEDGKVVLKTIAERLKAEKGYKVGIISTVYLNHATPAAFYGHQKSRNMYYEIGLDLIKSGFDYFGGGGLNDVTNGGKAENLYTLAQRAGYTVINTREGAEALTPSGQKAIVVAPPVDAQTITVPYRMDATDADWALSDYVEKGIQMIDNDKGFFMMVESGKIDWACHAHDSNAAVSEVLALGEAVQVAVEFYRQHPNETLILVTGDHETGGMSLGNASTGYTLRPKLLQRQTMSFTMFNKDYIAKYKKDRTPFATVLGDIERVFGIAAPNRAAGKDPALVMTQDEYAMLQKAYQKTMANTSSRTEAEELLYGPYEPLSVTANHILNAHIGINFGTYDHTAAPLPVYALGAGAGVFTGVYHQSAIFTRLCGLTGLKITP
jgi:alkaline phosphatase